jgi:hypothetical protein
MLRNCVTYGVIEGALFNGFKAIKRSHKVFGRDDSLEPVTKIAGVT